MEKSNISLSKTIRDLFTEYKHSRTIIIPRFQRRYIWSTKQQQLLVDSVLRGYDIPKLYFSLDNDGGVYSIIDGQQRTKTLANFLDGKFAIASDTIIENEDLSNLKYSELPEKFQKRYNLFQLDIKILKGYDDSDIDEAFLRLQAGTPLTPAEKRHTLRKKAYFKKKGML